MDFRIDPDQRARFKHCRRQWDFASPYRRALEPLDGATPALSAALRDGLAVYYYPGTWDWQHDLKQSLVHKAVERSLNEAGTCDLVGTATALLDCYDAWASTVDDFAPVKIDHDVAGMLTDPSDPGRGLLAPNGSGVVYSCRIDLLAVDAGVLGVRVRSAMPRDVRRCRSGTDSDGAVSPAVGARAQASTRAGQLGFRPRCRAAAMESTLTYISLCF